MKMQVNANKIKQLREQRCWSQQQMSEMAGISLRTLQRVEAKSVASQETIKSIASVLELNCDLLLPEVSKPLNADQLETAARDSSHEALEKSKTQRQLVMASIIVCVSSGLGFWGVFTAYTEQRIDYQDFMLFKDIVSIGFLISIVGIGYKAFKKGLISFSDLG